MSYTIDNRVVEMEFNNRDFEKNVHQSISTLDKLKAALKLDKAANSFNNLEKASKGVTLDGISDALDNLQDKFSGFEVFGNQIIRNLANSFYGLGQQVMGVVKSMSIDQISAGMTKYEEKIEAVQQIMNATGLSIDTVNDYLEKLMWYSDETSYSFTDMASNVGKFTSAGIDLETATTAMMGIANWAAVSGVNAQGATRAMYNLSQALGMGKLTMQDWKTLESLNMTTQEFNKQAIEAGVAAGTLIRVGDAVYTVDQKMAVTATNIRETLSKGWFNKDVMMSVFSKYGDYTNAVYELADSYDTCAEAMEHVSSSGMELSAKAFKAAQEAKTWTDVLNATKDAVSSGWMTTFETIFGNYEEAKKTWTDITQDFWELFASSGVTRNRALKKAFSEDYGIKGIEDKIKEAGMTMSDFYKSVSNMYDDNGMHVMMLIDKYGSLENAMRQGGLSAGDIRRALRNMIPEVTTTAKETVNLEEKLVEIREVVNQVLRGEHGHGQNRRNALAELGYDYEYIQDLVNKVYYGGQVTMDDMAVFADSMVEVTEVTNEQVEAFQRWVEGSDDSTESLEEFLAVLGRPSGRSLFIGSLQNILKSIVAIKDAFDSAKETIFGDEKVLTEAIYNLTASFYRLTSRFFITEERGEKLSRVFGGLLSIVKLLGFAGNALLRILSPITKALSDSAAGIGDYAAGIGDTITKFVEMVMTSERVEAAIVTMTGAVQRAVDFIGKVIAAVRGGIEWLVTSPYWTAFKNHCLEIGRAIKKWVSPYLRDARKAIDTFVQKLESISYEDIVDIFNTITSAISSFYQTCVQIKDAVVEFVSPYLQLAAGAFVSVLGPVWNYISAMAQHLNEVRKTKGLYAAIIEGLSGLRDGFTKLKNKISDFVKSGGIKKIFEGFEEQLKPVKEAVGKFIDDIREKIEEADWGKIVTGTGIFLLLISILKIADGISKIGEGFKNLTSLSKSITNFLNDFKAAFTTTPLQKIAQACLIFAVAIAILAGSLWALSKVPIDDLVKGGVALASLMVLLAGVAIILSVVTKKFGTGFGELALSLISFAGAVALLAGALWIISKAANEKGFWSGFAALLVLMAALGGIAIGLAKLAPVLSKGGFSMLLFAASMLILALALEKMGKIAESMKPEVFEQAGTALALLMVAMGVLAAGASVLKFGGGVGMLAAVGSIFLLLEVFKRLADPQTATMIKQVLANTEALITLGGTIVLLGGVLALASRLGGNNVAKAGVGIALMAGSLWIIMQALSVYAEIPEDRVNRGLGAVLGILALFTLITLALGAINEHSANAGKAMLQMSVAILLLYFAVKNLGELDDEVFAKGILAVGGILAMFTLATLASGKAGSAGSVLAMAVAVAVIVAAIAALTLFDFEDILKAVITLSMVLIAFGAAVSLTSTFSIGSNVASIAAMAAVVVAIAAALYFLALQPWGQLLAAAVSLGAVMVALGLSVKAASSVSAIGPAGLMTLAIMIGVLVIVAYTLEELATIDYASLLGAAGSIALVLLAIAGVIAIMSLINPAAALAGMITFGEVIVGMIAAFAIIGALGTLLDTYLNDAFSRSLDKAQEIMFKLGEIIGSVVAGFGVSASSCLPVIGYNLGQFAENAQPFFDMVRDTKDSNAGVKNLASAVLTLTEANFLNGIQNWLSRFGMGDLASFGENLSAFAEDLKDFMGIVSSGDFDAAKVDTVAGVVRSLSDMTKSIPADGGVITFFTGKHDLAKFGEGLNDLAAALVTYMTTLNGLPGDAQAKADASAAVIRSLADAANSIPNSGGLIAKILGDNDAGAFGTGLQMLGTGVKNFVTSMDGVTEDAASEARSKLAHVLGAMQLVANATGLENVQTNGTYLSGFADLLSVYAPKITQAALDLAELNTDNIGAVLAGLSTLAAVGTQLSMIANTFSANYTSLLNTLLETAGTDISATFANSFVNGLALYNATVQGAAETTAEYATSGMSQTSIAYAAGTNMGVSYANGLSAMASIVASAAEGLAMTVVNHFGVKLQINSPSRVFERFGEYTGQGYVNGLKSMYTQVRDVTDGLGSSAIDAASMTLNRANNLLKEDFSFQPVISPVLDLTNVRSGADQINDMFNGDWGLTLPGSLSGATSQAIDIGRRMQTRANSAINSATVTAESAASNVFSPTVNVYPDPGMDTDELTNKVLTEMQNMYVRSEVARG